MKKLLLLLLLPLAMSGQAVRYNWTAYTINSSAPQPGVQYPVFAMAAAQITICTYSATAQCAAVATTYTDASEATACDTTLQLTASQSATCTANADLEGNWGVWIAPGNYQYLVTTSYGTFGPYQFTAGGSGGGSGTCGPLAGDATSTTCGTGNFSTFTGATNQAYGDGNFVNANASFSVGMGYQTLKNVATVPGTNSAEDVIAIGYQAGDNIPSGSNFYLVNAIGIGNQALNNSNGTDIVALGQYAGSGIISTSSAGGCWSLGVIGIGTSAVTNSATPLLNVVAVGEGAATGLGRNQTASCSATTVPLNITAIGGGAGAIVVDAYSGGPVMSPVAAVSVGDTAGQNSGGNNTIAIGQTTGGWYLAGSHDNIAIGQAAGIGPEGSVGGHFSPTSVVNNLIAIGLQAGRANAGNDVIAIGDDVLTYTAATTFPTAGNTGNYNIGIGTKALPANTTGTHNIAIGYYVGGNGFIDCGLGCGPMVIGNSNTTGSQNTWIGDNSGPTTTAQRSNTIALGYNAFITASNQTVIGNSSITSLILFGCPSGQAIEADGSGTCFTPGGAGITLTTTGTSGAATLVGSTLNIPVYGGGGGGSFTQITKTVLASPAASITFSGIAGTYSSLQVVLVGASSSASEDGVALQFNGDTGANYDAGGVFNSASASSGFSLTAQTKWSSGAVVPPSSATSRANSSIIDLPLYSSTAFFKQIQCTQGGWLSASSFVQSVVVTGDWKSTAAITSVNLFLTSGSNFVTGTTAILYGIQ